MAHLATATERPDCLVAICGADGSGKTTLLNRYITSLGEDVCFATIDETCNGEKDFFCAFLKQLGFTEISGTSSELWRITKEFLVHRGMAGDPVLLIIDNAHLINPNVLEQLRRMCAIKVNSRHVLSIVLTGNTDLDRVMESPAMSAVKFDSQVHFNIRVYTEEETANYVWHRLRLAGGSDVVKFSNEAHPLIYRYTGGIPKLINLLCNELLTEAFTADTHDITEELVRTVADSRKLMPHVVPLQGKGRRKTDPDFRLVQPDEESGERITPRGSDAKGAVKKPKAKSKKSAAGDENLLEQISELSAQVGEFRADKMQALEDLATRDKEISELHANLEVKVAESEKLNKALKDHAAEIGQLKKTVTDNAKALKDSEKAANKLTTELEKERNAATAARDAETEKVANLIDEHGEEVERLKQALADSTKALLQSEKASTKIAKDLEKERKAANSAQGEVAKVNAKVEELNRLKADLETNLDELKADLKEADERVAQNGDRDKDSEKLKDSIEKKVSELASLQDDLDSRNEAVGDLEELLEESKQECVALRLKVAVLKNLEESAAKKDAEIAALRDQLSSTGKKKKKSKKAGKEPESSEVEQEQAERIAILESELHEARNMLQRTQSQLTESEKIIAETGSSRKPDLSELDISLEEGSAVLKGISSAEEPADEEPADEEPVAEESADEESVTEEPDLEEVFAEDAANLEAAVNELTGEMPVVEESTSAVATLEVFHDGESEQVLEIAEGNSRIMVGRSEDSELCLKSEFVSRHHALIICNKEGLYIEDLNSFNGTLVNSEKISRHKMQDGDTITIGKFEIKLKTA
jgi:type II secretory pathway predicted ATPase ExeA/ABC-type transporter Mla subunit MlaD